MVTVKIVEWRNGFHNAEWPVYGATLPVASSIANSRRSTMIEQRRLQRQAGMWGATSWHYSIESEKN